jgi:glycosyltransferase involved in cell wall biosynthesis
MRKNILIFGHNYAIQFIDICNQYTRLFDPEKFAVTVVYLSGTPDAAVREKTLAEEVIFLNYSRKAIGGLKIRAILHLIKFCRSQQFDIVICHRYKPSYIMLLAAQFCRIPALFFVMHDLHTMRSLPRRLLITGLIRKNMVFAGVSNAVRDDLRKALNKLPPSQIITLYNVMDLELAQPHLLTQTAAREQLQLPKEAFIFGNVARLEYMKDHHNLIQAFAAIKPNCPQALLIIFGDGSLEATLKAQAHQLKLENDIIFAGFINNSFRLFHAFDTFVLTSTREAFGRVLLEAMHAKLPIIATRVDGIPEVVDDSGFLIDASDVKQLSAAMLNTYQLSTTERQDWGAKGYHRLQTHFTITSFYQTFWQLPLIQNRDSL